LLKPKVLISQTADEVGKKFKRLHPCFPSQAVHRLPSGNTVSRMMKPEVVANWTV